MGIRVLVLECGWPSVIALTAVRYYPIEIHPTMSHAEKIPHMVEWHWRRKNSGTTGPELQSAPTKLVGVA